MALDVKAQLEVLARMERSEPGLPFARDANGKLRNEDYRQRESILRAVQDVYQGEFWKFIDPMPGSNYAEAVKKPGQIRLQYLKSWVDTLRNTYGEEPQRVLYKDGNRVEATDKIAERIHAEYRRLRIDEHFNELDRELALYGNVVLRPVWDADFKEVVLDRYVAHRVRVVHNPRQPARPLGTALMGEVCEYDKSMTALKLQVADAYVTPTPKQQGLYREFGAGRDTGWQNLATPQPPLVHCSDVLFSNEFGYYVSAPGRSTLGELLAKLNVAVNEDFLCRLGLTILMQMHGQWVSFGMAPGDSIKIGPDRVVDFPGNPQIKSGLENVASNADLQGGREAIEFILREIRSVHGIPASEIDVGEDSSGKSRIEARAPTYERRMQRMKVFRPIETEFLHTLLMALSQFDDKFPRMTPEQIKAWDVAVVHKPPVMAAAVSERITWREHQLKHGLKTPAQLLIEDNPDQFDTVEEAEAELTKRQAQAEKSKKLIDPKPPAASGEEDDDELDDEQT